MHEKNNIEENFLIDSTENAVNPFGRKWSDTVKQIKEKSIYRNFETYSVKSFIAKANDDLRQEVMTMQLIKRFDDIFKKAEIPLKLKPYEILITSPSSGLIEFLPNTISIDALKKNLPPKWNLNIFFRKFFNNNFEEAQKNFAESLAAYSLVTFMVAIRDRHNGNILLDMNGHIIHIDFGFILGISPGNLNFESAPFKLTMVRIKKNLKISFLFFSIF
jgi:phosphatidylinositol 4-kinase